jgi:hypothetical protein
MSKTKAAAQLGELKERKLPHAQVGDVPYLARVELDPSDPEVRALLDEYLAHFLPPTRVPDDYHQSCLQCGEQLFFVWGLAHGHGHCRKCGYPATAYHFVKRPDGTDLCRLEAILQAHPDDLEVKK